MERPICVTCAEEGIVTYLHSSGCLKCLTKNQRRIVVPFEDFANYYFNKYGHAMPCLVDHITQLTEPEFIKAMQFTPGEAFE